MSTPEQGNEAADGQSRLTAELGADLTIPDFLRNQRNLVAEKDAEIARLRSVLEEIAYAYYASGETLRQVAGEALEVPNAALTGAEGVRVEGTVRLEGVENEDND